MYYYIPQPPVFLPVIGLFIGLVFGVTFQKQLETINQQWRKKPEAKDSFLLSDRNLQLSYQGICLGVWLFLGGGFKVLGFGVIGAYGISLLITVGTGAFMWQQLGEMLLEIKENGLKSLNLDEFV